MSQEATSHVFYIDRCLGRQVASTLSQAGLTVRYHDDEFPQNALDVEWLPQVGERGWIVLTKDANIGKNAIERLAVTRANIRLFTLGRQNLTGDEMAEIFLKASVPMQNYIRKNPAPFIAKIQRSGKVELWRDRDTLLQEVEVRLLEQLPEN